MEAVVNESVRTGEFVIFQGRNPQTIEEALQAIYPSVPREIASPGKLIFPPSPVQRARTTTEHDDLPVGTTAPPRADPQ